MGDTRVDASEADPGTAADVLIETVNCGDAQSFTIVDADVPLSRLYRILYLYGSNYENYGFGPEDEIAFVDRSIHLVNGEAVVLCSPGLASRIEVWLRP